MTEAGEWAGIAEWVRIARRLWAGPGPSKIVLSTLSVPEEFSRGIGKTLRGSIGTGETRGEHLLAAYLPGEGVVLAQVAVDRKENEITAAVLETIGRDKVVSGDAMLTQREPSEVVERGGDAKETVNNHGEHIGTERLEALRPFPVSRWRRELVPGAGSEQPVTLVRKRLAGTKRCERIGAICGSVIRNDDGGDQQSGSGIAAAPWGQKRAPATPVMRPTGMKP